MLYSIHLVQSYLHFVKINFEKSLMLLVLFPSDTQSLLLHFMIFWTYYNETIQKLTEIKKTTDRQANQ